MRAVIIDLESSYDLDVPGADMVRSLATELGQLGVSLSLARVHPDVLRVLARTGAIDVVAGTYPRTIDAVRSATRS